MRYWQHEWNLESLDGLPGLQNAYKILLSSSSSIRGRPSTKAVLKKTPAAKNGEEVATARVMVERVRLAVAFLFGLLVATGFSMLVNILRGEFIQLNNFSRSAI
jgi:hypothetical protein